MGGDGQALINSRKLLEGLYKAGDGEEAKRSRAGVEAQNRMQYCALTHEPLQEPVCCDLSGRLYNRSAIVDMLLQRKLTQEATSSAVDLGHVQRLKDVRDLVGAAVPNGTFEILCPVTGRRAGASRFCFACNWRCGHVVSVGEAENLAIKTCPVPSCTPEEEDPQSNIWVRLGLDEAAADAQKAALSMRIRKRGRSATGPV